MRRLSPLSTAVVLAVTAVTLHWTPAAAVGGAGGGADLDCVPSGPSFIAQGSTLKQVEANDTLHCPAPVNAPGGSFGPGDRRTINAPPPRAGDPCHFAYQAGLPLRYAGNYLAKYPIPVGNPPPSWGDAGFDEILASQAFPDPGSFGAAISPVDAFFRTAGTTDYYVPWTYDGTWQLNGGRLVCGNAGNQWRSPCDFAQLIPDCLVARPRVVTGGQPPIALLGENLPNLVNGRFSGGDISAVPDPRLNHPGLVNLKTCFYVTNMRVDGQPADPNREVVFEKTVVGGVNIDEGRHVVYVFRIHVHRIDTVFDFGDGSQVVVPLNGSSPEDPTGICAQSAPAGQQFLVAHTYTRYSPAGGFPITIRHRYGIDLQEFWFDSSGSNRIDLPNVVPSTEVLAAPEPFLMPIVQEEGVPVG